MSQLHQVARGEPDERYESADQDEKQYGHDAPGSHPVHWPAPT